MTPLDDSKACLTFYDSSTLFERGKVEIPIGDYIACTLVNELATYEKGSFKPDICETDDEQDDEEENEEESSN